MHNRSGWGVRGDDAIDATAVLPCPLHGVRRILRRHERDDGWAGTGDERLAGSRTQGFLDRLSATRMQGDRRLLQVVLIAIAGTADVTASTVTSATANIFEKRFFIVMTSCLLNLVMLRLYISNTHTHRFSVDIQKYSLHCNTPGDSPIMYHGSNYLLLLSFPVYPSSDPIQQSSL